MIAQVSCSCNNYHRFCLRDYLFTHNRIEGSHIPINLALRKEEISQKFNSTIKNLKLVKSKIISKTNQLIHIIQLIATQQISIIKKNIVGCKKILKSSKLDSEKIFKDYENIDIREVDLEPFVHIVTKNFSFFKEVNEIIESDNNKLINESKSLDEIKKQLQSNFNLFLEGHTSSVNSLLVTNDQKYMISGSNDKNIII